MKKVSFKTLGCRLNQYETDALVTQFHQAGYQVVKDPGLADITVINTCTVTNQSDQKSRHTINQAVRKNREGLVVVTGCMANNHKEKLEANKHITYVVDNERKSQNRYESESCKNFQNVLHYGSLCFHFRLSLKQFFPPGFVIIDPLYDECIFTFPTTPRSVLLVVVGV